MNIIEANFREVAELLKSRKMNIDEKDEEDETALHLATQKGVVYISVVMLLIEAV